MKRFSLDRVNVYTIVRDLMYSWWVILLAAIVGSCSCYIYFNALKQKEYTSSMTISVNLSGYTTNATYTSLTRTIEVAGNVTNILNSDALLKSVEKQTGEPVVGYVYAVQREETNIIELSVTANSPDVAYKNLKKVWENSGALTGNAFNNLIISAMTSPGMDTTVSNNRIIMRNCVFSGLLGALICCAVIALLSFLRDTVKNVSDVENLLDGKLFETVYHVNKAKSKIQKKNDGLLITNPLIPHVFAHSFLDMVAKLESYRHTRNINSVMLTSFSENEGKTTVSVNLAIALASVGNKVALVDADFKLPAVYKFFDKFENDGTVELVDYLKNNDAEDFVLHKDKKTNVYLACNVKAHSNSSEVLSTEKFKQFIKKLESEYDFVIVDTPPAGVAIDAEFVSECTSSMLFVVRQDYSYVEPINDCLSDIANSKILGFIFNDVSDFSKNKEEVSESYEYTFEG